MGRVVDGETGLQYLRARYYDPATGQFLTRDPIAALTGSPYGYVYGDPLNRVDPSGLFGWRSALKIGGAVAVGALVAAAVVVTAPAWAPVAVAAAAGTGFVLATGAVVTVAAAGLGALATLAAYDYLNMAEEAGGTWMTLEEAANADAKEIIECHRGRGGDFESGRHGEGPRRAAREIGELANQAQKNGMAPEYVNRLRQIQKTMADRVKSNHPGGRR